MQEVEEAVGGELAVLRLHHLLLLLLRHGDDNIVSSNQCRKELTQHPTMSFVQALPIGELPRQ